MSGQQVNPSRAPSIVYRQVLVDAAMRGECQGSRWTRLLLIKDIFTTRDGDNFWLTATVHDQSVTHGPGSQGVGNAARSMRRGQCGVVNAAWAMRRGQSGRAEKVCQGDC